MKELKIGIAGLGVVAQGLLDIVRNNGALIAERTGVSINVVRVASRTKRPGVDLMGAESLNRSMIYGRTLKLMWS